MTSYQYEGRLTKNKYLGPQFSENFRALFFGPTGSGKTSLVFDLLNTDDIFKNKFDKITYFYNVYQEIFKNKKILFIQGPPLLEHLNEKNTKDRTKHKLWILDDLMSYFSANNIFFSNLFTQYSHHNNISIMLLVQNLFYKSPVYRTASINCSHLIIFKSPRDSSVIIHLSKQIFPGNPKILNSIYKAATYNKAYSYIFIDLTQNMLDKFRISTNITTDKPLFYIEQNE